MNTERLFTISDRLTTDLEQTSSVETLASLTRLLQNQQSSPTSANTTEIETLLAGLEAIRENKRFDYPETWNQSLEHIGASFVKKARFAEEAINAVRGNGITLETALKEVKSVHNRLNKTKEALGSVFSAFTDLALEAYEVEEGEAELSILMPRDAFKNELRSFSKDLLELARFLELAEEISTGSRTPVQLDELSTTDPVIFAGLSVSACLLVIKIIRDVIDLITSTYVLREARAKALIAEASQKTLDAIDSDIDAKIENGLKKIVDAIGGSRPRGRKNELKIELTQTLPKIAARIDNGYRIEGAAGTSEELSEEEQKDSEASQINNISREIRYAALPSTPVLKLTFSASEPAEDGAPEAIHDGVVETD